MFADRLKNIKPFRVMEINELAVQMENQGHKVVHFEVGEPDFPTAQTIAEAGKRAIDLGWTKYTAALGIPELREKISGYYGSKGVHVATDRIVITTGASGGLTLLSALLLNPGDEILVTDPGYPANEVFGALVNASHRRLALNPKSDFQLSMSAVISEWDREITRGLLISSPSNPTGVMLERETLSGLAREIKKLDGFLILDEVYQGLIYKDDCEYWTGIEIDPDIYLLNSFSKYFGMTGWRIGWMVVPASAVEPLSRLAQNLFICPPTISQYAAIAAFETESLKIHEERRAQFAKRRDLLAEGLTRLGFTIPVYPDGAFYIYADVSFSGMTSTEFCGLMIEKYHVAITPGTDFGTYDADRYVRFSYTTSVSDIKRGLNQIEKALLARGIF